MRPALIIADAGRGDFVVCQITGDPYQDPEAIEITSGDIKDGELARTSYVRPRKLMTVNISIMQRQVGILSFRKRGEVIAAIQRFLLDSLL